MSVVYNLNYLSLGNLGKEIGNDKSKLNLDKGKEPNSVGCSFQEQFWELEALGSNPRYVTYKLCDPRQINFSRFSTHTCEMGTIHSVTSLNKG